tara:strand:- start:127 stop:609 length:483 start_codon:yes stop_codon:yes gene_type:complete
MKWLDNSDSESRFYVSESSTELDGTEFSSFINEVLVFIKDKIMSERSVEYDKLFLEVNCDTGRLIISPSTEKARAVGSLDGCAIRLPRLQDVWYDLDESGVSGEVFSEGIKNEIIRIGELFGLEIDKQVESFSINFSQSSFELIVFGSEPEKVLYRKMFS